MEQDGGGKKQATSRMLTIEPIVTSTIAILGLGLSIYNTMQARRDKRPQLRVRVTFGFLTFGPQLSDEKIFFDVGNPWNQSITVVSLLIPLPDKRSIAFLELEGQNQMPVTLAPGISTQFWFNLDQLAAETFKAGINRHRKFRVMARDALGNEYLSNPVSLKPTKK